MGKSMPWDDDKSTGDELTSDEWDAHVTDQKGHASRHEKGGSDETTTFGDTTHDSVTTNDINTPGNIETIPFPIFHTVAKKGSAATNIVWDASEDMWRILQRDLADQITEGIGWYPVQQGTSSSPAVFGPWDAKVEGETTNAKMWVGAGEEAASRFGESIFILSDEGTASYSTRSGGVSTVTDISGSVDMSVKHTYKVEWTDEPRATLFVDGSQVAEHTTNVPSPDLVPFFETSHKSTAPGNVTRNWVSDGLFRSPFN